MFKFLKKDKMISIKAPMTGTCIELDEVPDEVFANKMVGDGIAINPSDGIVVSPCDGKVVQIFPTKHAIGIQTHDGIEILIHVGIDTVKFKGKGFSVLTKVGDIVKVGKPILEVDLDYIQKNAKSIISPMIITNIDKVKRLSKSYGTVSSAQNEVMTLVLK